MNLKSKPFFLNDEDIEWVNKTRENMTLEQKVGQLFCIIFRESELHELDDNFNILEPGGCMYRPTTINKAVPFTIALRERTKVPMLIAANLEKGGNGILEEGTLVASPLELAATDDSTMVEKMATVCAREAKTIGANWSFAPIIDIDDNFRNPITNTRTFGSDVERVKKMGISYVNAIQKNGFAASIKHFPGDGQDERDQHLVTSINSMTCDEWDSSYGKVYKACIDEGALTCMIGHIMQPAYSKRLNPELKDEDILPASLSKELMQGLLRDKLGFNGMIVTDATTMAGFTIPMSRNKAVPYSIEAGADMFLFSRNLQEDYQFMLDGVKKGILSNERLNQAVTRILAVKAALGLHKELDELSLVQAKEVVGCQEHKNWARECADKAITLVKNKENILPITKEKYKKILFHAIEPESGGAGPYKVVEACGKFAKLLEKEGFDLDYYIPPTGKEGKTEKFKDITEKYDLILYVANISTKSNQTTVRIEWAQPMGANCPHYINDVPTMFISLENPYHLLDVPRIRTFINTYSSHEEVIKELVEKLTGRSEFKGVNPIDPFCGKWDTHL